MELERRLAAAHGCPRGCEACAHARAQQGVPALILSFADFVRSEDALRAARLVKRTGQPFPRLTDDDVVQFCIEEAVMERLHYAEHLNRQLGAAADPEGPGPQLPPGERAALEHALEQAREFASGRSG